MGGGCIGGVGDGGSGEGIVGVHKPTSGLHAPLEAMAKRQRRAAAPWWQHGAADP